MSVVVRFALQSLTAEQYDSVSARIEETPDWPPEGLAMHVCFGSDGDLKVSEIWDSQEQFEASSKTLMPVLAEGGIQMAGEPEIFPVHNLETR